VDFELTEAQRLVRESVREFAARELAPVAGELDRRGEFPAAALRGLAGLGVLGMTLPASAGGAGADAVSGALAVMEIARACASTAVSVSVHNSLVCETIWRHGSEAQRAKLLPPLTGGGCLGAFALTEPSAGSDAGAIRLAAVRRGEGYRLTGSKLFVTNGSRAGLIVLFAVTDPGRGEQGLSAFVLEPPLAGLTVGRREAKMGLRASDTVELVLDDCRVPEESRMGAEGEGLRIALGALVAGRIGIAAQAVGIAQACLDASRRYARQRRQFGRPIGSFQAIQWKLADMATEIAAARLLTLRAAARRDRGLLHAPEASMAKLFASEAANRAAAAAAQIHGGYGYLQDFPVERYLRDARVLTIYEGTSEIHRVIIGRHVVRRGAGTDGGGAA
jgi:alkylation response protein AidB-like acyl-CoA dehydrogenase